MWDVYAVVYVHDDERWSTPTSAILYSSSEEEDCVRMLNEIYEDYFIHNKNVKMRMDEDKKGFSDITWGNRFRRWSVMKVT